MINKSKAERDSIILNIFWFGILIYIISYLISQSEMVSYVVCNLFQVMGILLFLPTAVMLISFKIENKYLAITYSLFLIWTLTVIARGIKFDYDSIKDLLFRPILGLFLYLLPLVMLFQRTSVFIRKLFSVLLVAGSLYLVLGMIFIKTLVIPYDAVTSQALTEYFTQHLSLPVGFLLLTYLYRSNKLNLYSLFIVICGFLLAVIRARRGLMFMTFSILFFSYLIYQYVNKARIFNIIISALFILFVALAAARIYDQNRKSTFSLITERIIQQTRSEVEQYFYNDLKSQDWVVGKGINGQYFCPGVREGIGRVSVYRTVIETGYLQIILNGGIISLIFILLIMIPAIILGLFYSRNILAKASAIWILLFFFYIYPGTPTIFSINYMLVWISVGIAYSPSLRGMNEDEFRIWLGIKGKSASEIQISDEQT
jgi:hypothetical protein